MRIAYLFAKQHKQVNSKILCTFANSKEKYVEQKKQTMKNLFVPFRRWFLLFLFSAVCLLTIPCWAKKNPNFSDRSQDNLFEKVKNVQIMEYSVVIQNEKIQKGEVVMRTVKSYNREGYITENTEFDADNAVLQQEISIFDKKGNKIEELLYNENNELEQYTKIKYNPQNLPVQTVSQDSKGRKIQRFTYRYDERGNLTQLTGYDDRGKMSEKSYYSYDPHGNLIKYLGFGQFDNRKIYYKYDPQHKLTEQFCTDIKNNFMEKIIYQYKNDGKWEERTFTDANNQVLSTLVYVYDDYANLLKFVRFDKDGVVTEQHEFTYQYDKNNNWIQQIFYSGTEKTVISITERGLEYY